MSRLLYNESGLTSFGKLITEAATIRYVRLENSLINDFTGGFTVEFAIKRKTLTGTQTIFGKNDDDNPNTINARIQSGNLIVYLRANGVVKNFTLADAYNLLPLNTWVHFAISINPVSGNVKAYINAKPVPFLYGVTGFGTTNVALENTQSPWTIGAGYNSVTGIAHNSRHDSEYKEFRVWSSVRTDQEIEDNYDREIVSAPNLVHRISFKDTIDTGTGAATVNYVNGAVYDPALSTAVLHNRLLTSRTPISVPINGHYTKDKVDAATQIWDDRTNTQDASLVGSPTVNSDGVIGDRYKGISLPKNGRFVTGGSYSFDLYVTLSSVTTGTTGTLLGSVGSVDKLTGFRFGTYGNTGSNNPHMEVWCKDSQRVRIYRDGVEIANITDWSKVQLVLNSLIYDKPTVYTFVVEGLGNGVSADVGVMNMIASTAGNSFNTGMTGTLHGFAVYDRAVTAQEAKSNYNYWAVPKPLVSQSKQPYMLNPVAGSGRVAYGTPAHLQNLSSFTVEMLVKPINMSGGSTIISKTNNTTNGFKLFGGSVAIAGPSGVTTLSNGGYTNGAWTIYAFKYDASTRKLSTFKNLELVAETTLADATWYTPNNDFVLHLLAGHTNAGALAALATCDLAYCRIYNRAKTDAEIKADGLKHTINDSSIVLQTVGGVMPDGKIRDLSSYLNHGTPTNISILPSTAPVGQRSGLKFNGTNSTVDTGIGNGFNMNTNPITISCWTAGNTTNETKILFGSAVGTNQRLFVGVIQGKWDIGIQGSSWSGTGAELVAYKQGVMTHIALVLDGFTAKLLVNGVVTRVKSYTSYTLSSNIHIGSIPSSFYWNGVISNVTVYNGAVAESILLEHKHSYLLATTPNLIEQWKLNEGIGNIAYGTKGNNGTITGASWTTPSLMNYVGKQLRLNGTTDYVTVPHNPLLRTFPLTIECIVKTSDMAGGLINLYEANSTNGLLLTLTNTGQPEFYYFGNASNYVYIAPSGAGVADNTHHHIAVTLTASGAKLYVDNTLRSTIAWTGTPMQATSSFPLLLGRYNINSSFYFGGVLDNVRIWNVERTQAELLETMWRDVDRHPNLLFNMGFESGYWDASGYGNHGTAVGSPVIEVTDNDKLLLNAPIN